MKYFYFNPFNKQYLFPTGFKKYELFSTFYQAYTFKGKLLWWLWCNVSLLRNWCQVAKPEDIVPISQLNKYIKKNTILAFNRGTEGIEQKTSILGLEIKTQEEFFIKYANTELSRKNVNNEGEILRQLSYLDFVPQLKQHVNEDEFTFIQTSVLMGERVVNQNIDKQLLDVLKIIASLKIDTKQNYNTTLKTCFAHGDFCPWNMMLNGDELQIFDWEMASIYPIGYDLFTYVFQTSFLLTPSKKITDIINDNKKLINNYFEAQNINNWEPYLFAFSDIKLKLETEKNSLRLLPYYQQLKSHVR